jgi:hypothetical protein
VVERESGRYDQRQTQHLQHIFYVTTLSVKDSVTGILIAALAFRGFNWNCGTIP